MDGHKIGRKLLAKLLFFSLAMLAVDFIPVLTGADTSHEAATAFFNSVFGGVIYALLWEE